MLVHDKHSKTDETTTQTPAPDAPGTKRRRRWIAAVVGATVLVGAVTIATATERGSDAGNPGGSPDDSHDIAELNRMEAVRDLSTLPVPGDSYETVEANRMEVLRDLATLPVPGDSYETVEANRMEVLRDLTTTAP